jgi:hypothetical protein
MGEHCYDYIIRFEEAFRQHLGVRHALATSSCTGALHMGLHALGIGPGDEVIMADSNLGSTAVPIVHLGALALLLLGLSLLGAGNLLDDESNVILYWIFSCQWNGTL